MAFIYHLKNGNVVVYVGQSKDWSSMMARIKSHKKLGLEHNGTQFREVEDDMANDEEAMDIVDHDPEYNKNLPPSYSAISRSDLKDYIIKEVMGKTRAPKGHLLDGSFFPITITITNDDIINFIAIKKKGLVAIKGKEVPKPSTVVLPDFLDKELWSDFLEHRKKLKAPNTARALNSLLKKLSGFHNDGHDVNAIIQESYDNGWKSVFEPKKIKGNKGSLMSKNTRNAQEFIDRKRMN